MPLSPETWIAFVAASAVLLAIPGPTILLVVGYALAEGRRSIVPTATGVLLGDFVAMTAAVIGLGAVLAASASAFMVLKWIGALYLIYLGVQMWRSAPSEFLDAESAKKRRSSLAMVSHAFLVTASNPKSILFFIAFLPQFISDQTPIAPQMLVLGGTFLVLAEVAVVAYALLANRVRALILKRNLLRLTQRLSGGVLIAAGVLTAALRRPA